MMKIIFDFFSFFIFLVTIIHIAGWNQVITVIDDENFFFFGYHYTRDENWFRLGIYRWANNFFSSLLSVARLSRDFNKDGKKIRVFEKDDFFETFL